MTVKRKGFMILMLILAVFAIVVFGFLTNGQEGIEEPKVGKVAPGFRLADLSGKMVELKAVYQKNPVTLVNFWATWCPPCRREIPEFNRIYQEYQAKGLEILAVNTWDDSSLEQIKEFVEQAEMKFPVLLDAEGKVVNRYGVRGVPTTVVIDQTGRIREIVVGMMNYHLLKSRLDQLLLD